MPLPKAPPPLRALAETHIVTLIGPGEAPEWGCDDVWNGGAAVLERCAAVFAIMYRLGGDADMPGYLETATKEAPLVAGAEAPLSAGHLNIGDLLPTDLSYYTYAGSLVRLALPPPPASAAAITAATTWHRSSTAIHRPDVCCPAAAAVRLWFAAHAILLRHNTSRHCTVTVLTSVCENSFSQRAEVLVVCAA